MIERAPIVLFLASAATLLGALAFQFIGGLDPCVLCIYQRWPYLVVVGLCAFALVVKPLARPALFGCGIVFLVGVGLAAYHVGVEQGWVAGTAACGAGGGAASVDELRAQIMNAPTTRCDEVAWSLFGISMAGYNLLISLALAALSWFAGLRWRAETAATSS